MIKRSALAVLAAVALTPAATAAQQITSPYDFVEHSMAVWGFGSGVFADRGTVDVGPGSGFAGGIGFTARISGPFNFDARAAYVSTTRRVYNVLTADSAAVREDPMVGLDPVGTADLSLLLIDASLRFDVTGPRTWHRLQPYVLLGVGAALRVASDNDAAEEALPDEGDLRVRFENGLTGHVGAGVEAYLSDRLSLRVDARDVLWKVHVPAGFLVDGRIIDDEEWVQTAHLNVGLALRF